MPILHKGKIMPLYNRNSSPIKQKFLKMIATADGPKARHFVVMAAVIMLITYSIRNMCPKLYSHIP